MQIERIEVTALGASNKVAFSLSGGDSVAVVMTKICTDLSDRDAVRRAREILVQVTAFETSEGGSINRYDAISNGNSTRGARA